MQDSLLCHEPSLQTPAQLQIFRYFHHAPMDSLILIGFSGLMIRHDDKHVEEDEALLNPPPRNFRVSTAIKLSFIGVAILGVSFYFHSIKTKRDAEGKFILENYLAPIKPSLAVMPDIKAIDAKTGQLIDLTRKLEGFILLNIWATWCPPCREEMPSLDLLQQKLKGKLKIVALSVDDSMDAVKDFINVNQPSFTVLWDQDKQVPLKFGVKKYPETFLVNPQGQLVAQFSGPRDWSAKWAIDYFLNILQ